MVSKNDTGERITAEKASLKICKPAVKLAKLSALSKSLEEYALEIDRPESQTEGKRKDSARDAERGIRPDVVRLGEPRYGHRRPKSQEEGVADCSARSISSNLGLVGVLHAP